MKNTVIDMSEHFDVDATLEAVAKERFAMPPPVIAAFRQAAMKSAQRLLDLVSDDDSMEKLKPSEQIKLMELVFDRAYGKSETASSSMVALHRTGQGDVNGAAEHGKQLAAVEARMAKHDKGRGGGFPELAKAKAARKATLARQEPQPNGMPNLDDSDGYFHDRSYSDVAAPSHDGGVGTPAGMVLYDDSVRLRNDAIAKRTVTDLSQRRSSSKSSKMKLRIKGDRK